MTESPIQPTGNENLREYISGPNGWRFLAVIDDTGDIAGVYDLVTRDAWGPPAGNPITAAVTVRGTDDELDDPPVTVAGTALLANEDDPLADAVHEQSFADPDVVVDGSGELVLQHTVELPDT